ncbi:hypothetical protein E4T56_gene3170 [Termitomyces sp. T112]|nr:hypothetical protein E4T56_gene3170 [Termitomyces sp. T112]
MIAPLHQCAQGTDNYVVWEIKMIDILTDLDLIDYVEGTTMTPTNTEKVVKTKTWKTKDGKTLSAIQLHIGTWLGISEFGNSFVPAGAAESAINSAIISAFEHLEALLSTGAAKHPCTFSDECHFCAPPAALALALTNSAPAIPNAITTNKAPEPVSCPAASALVTSASNPQLQLLFGLGVVQVVLEALQVAQAEVTPEKFADALMSSKLSYFPLTPPRLQFFPFETEPIEQAGYLDGLQLCLTFCDGLHPSLMDGIDSMAEGHPDDEHISIQYKVACSPLKLPPPCLLWLPHEQVQLFPFYPIHVAPLCSLSQGVPMLMPLDSNLLPTCCVNAVERQVTLPATVLKD